MSVAFLPHQGAVCLYDGRLVYITDHRSAEESPIGEWWTFFYVRKDGSLSTTHGTKSAHKFAPPPRPYEVRIVSAVPGSALFADD